HHRYDVRLQDRQQALPRRLGPALLAGSTKAVAVLDGEADSDHSAVDRSSHLEPRLPKDPEHRAVTAEDIGVEDENASLAGELGEVLEQQRTHTGTLELVGDRKRDLGAMGRGGVLKRPPRTQQLFAAA